MGRIQIEASAVIDAPPEAAYAIVADYRTGHPAIVPKENFRDLAVEEGGYGAGTVIRARVRVGADERTVRHRVTEPEPGRVLIETDVDADSATTFTFTPLDDDRRVRVRIATEMAASPGIRGVVERLFAPPMLRRIYRKELRQLAAVAQTARVV
jgi:Polyketide cyclase / dehydrase and lipid transport